jgi:hypothetical protein
MSLNGEVNKLRHADWNLKMEAVYASEMSVLRLQAEDLFLRPVRCSELSEWDEY